MALNFRKPWRGVSPSDLGAEHTRPSQFRKIAASCRPLVDYFAAQMRFLDREMR